MESTLQFIIPPPRQANVHYALCLTRLIQLLTEDLGPEWHLAIEPFVCELRKDAFWFKHDSEDTVWLWKKLTRHYDLLQTRDDAAMDVRVVLEEQGRKKEEIDIDAQIQKLQDSWFKQSFLKD